jgi:hypothetical protein
MTTKSPGKFTVTIDWSSEFIELISNIKDHDVLILQPISWKYFKQSFKLLGINTNTIGPIETKKYLEDCQLKGMIGSKSAFGRLYAKLDVLKKHPSEVTFIEGKVDIAFKGYSELELVNSLPLGNLNRYDNNRLGLFLLDFVLRKYSEIQGLEIHKSFFDQLACKNKSPTKIKLNNKIITLLHRDYPLTLKSKHKNYKCPIELILKKHKNHISDGANIYSFNLSCKDNDVFFNFFSYKTNSEINRLDEISDLMNWRCFKFKLSYDRIISRGYINGSSEITQIPSIIGFHHTENSPTPSIPRVSEEEILTFLGKLTPDQLNNIEKWISLFKK